MQKESNVLHGVKWGIGIGVLYCLIIYLRYHLGATNPILFGLITIVGFIAVLVLLLISGFQRRKASGGYIELRDIFQSLFVAVLIFELFYAIFNYVYLKAIDPDFFQRLKESTEKMMETQGVNDEKIEKQLKNLDVDSARKMQASSVILNYLMNIAVMGVFALVFSLIIKRRRPPFEDFPQTQS